MPTPSGTKSVQDAIDIGMPFVRASGIMQEMHHQSGCNYSYRPPGYVCSCGVDGAVNRLALDIDKILEKFSSR